MDGDEHVGVVAVGDGRALAQIDELVGLARIDHFHVGHVFLNIGTQFLGHGQIDSLLGGDGTQGTRVFAAMTGVNDDGLYFFALLGQSEQRQQKKQRQCTKSENLAFYHIEFV